MCVCWWCVCLCVCLSVPVSGERAVLLCCAGAHPRGAVRAHARLGADTRRCAGRFRERVAGALVRVRQILDSTRAPQLPADVAHSYDDKYALAEFLSNAGLAALLNALERVGVDASALRAMLAWAAQHHIVTLRLQCQQTCRFERTDSRDVEASERVVNRTRQGGAPVEQSEVTVVTKVVEHVWDLALQWELLAFAGCDSDGGQRLSLERGVCATKLGTTGEIKQPPRPATRVDQPLDLDLTWLLLQISDELRLQFKIDRAAESCRTPRRNEDVDAVLPAPWRCLRPSPRAKCVPCRWRLRARFA